MQLKTLKYSEFEGTPQEWVLDEFHVQQKNLLVGKNASGKSRTLNIISALGKKLAGLQSPGISGNYDVSFSHDNKELRYQLKIDDDKVLKEVFSVDREVKLARDSNGEGEILAEQINSGERIRFQSPTDKLAAVVRQDSIQHNFLAPLLTWGASLRHFYFGSSLGKDHFQVFSQGDSREIDEKDPGGIVQFFDQGDKKFPVSFKKIIIDDMDRLGYLIDDISVRPPLSIRFSSGLATVVGLCVKEKELPGLTDQHSMSQGMFRAFSIFIQLNYFQMTQKATCVLVDDIGEGLDYERSCRLIGLLREKALQSNVQLILSTNDRFVMNEVPLEEWQVLQRKKNHVSVHNWENSRELFDSFKFTGLSNFSFLETDYINSGLCEQG